MDDLHRRDYLTLAGSAVVLPLSGCNAIGRNSGIDEDAVQLNDFTACHSFLYRAQGGFWLPSVISGNRYLFANVAADLEYPPPKYHEFGLYAGGDRIARAEIDPYKLGDGEREGASSTQLLEYENRYNTRAGLPTGWISFVVEDAVDADEMHVALENLEWSLPQEAIEVLAAPTPGFELVNVDITTDLDDEEAVVIKVTGENTGETRAPFKGAVNTNVPIEQVPGQLMASFEREIAPGQTETVEATLERRFVEHFATLEFDIFTNGGERRDVQVE